MNRKINIPLNEIVFEKEFESDPVGRVFYWNNKTLRAIKKYDAVCLELLRRNDIEEFFNLGLIRTEFTNFHLPGFEVVLEHHRIRYISYANEWCSAMLKDAGLMVLNLQDALLNNGYILKDGHPWNVLFEGCKPYFVDWGSIEKATPERMKWFVFEFQMRYIYPLYLRNRGFDNLSDYLYTIHNQFLTRNTIRKLLLQRTNLKLYIKFLFQDLQTSYGNIFHPTEIIKNLTNQLQASPITNTKTEWTNYPDRRCSTYSPDQNWDQKQLTVYEILKRIQPKLVLDFGSNKGWFARLAESLGATVIAADIDGYSLNELYNIGKEKELDILPIKLDLCEPTLQHGIRGSLLDSRKRYKSEMVFALAISHHILAKRKLSFDEIISYLLEYCSKYLIIEFISSDDYHVKDWDFSHIEDYSVLGFTKALKKYFKIVETFPSNLDTRKIFLCSM